MKKILMISLLALACLGALAGGIVIAIGPTSALALVGLGGSEAAAETGDDHGETEVDAGDGHGGDDGHGGPATLSQDDMPLLPFPEMIVNVTDVTASGRQTSRFLKLNLALLYDETAEGADLLPKRELYLRDTFQDFLRQLQVSDLQGSRGLAMLKTELLRRARAVGNTEAPRDILILDLVIQ